VVVVDADVVTAVVTAVVSPQVDIVETEIADDR
jgi:hypothetical protein